MSYPQSSFDFGGVPDSIGVVPCNSLQVERHLLIDTFLSAEEADFLPVAA